MAEDKSAGVEFLATTTGFDADGNAVTIHGTAANRVYAFSDDFVITKDTSVNPNVIRISSRNESALTARIAALEAKFDGTATVSFDRVQANFVSPASSVLKIQARNAPSGWLEGLTIDSNLLAITPVTRVAWFSATTVVRQTIPNVSALADTETALITYGLYTRLP